MKNTDILLNFWGEIQEAINSTPLNFAVDIDRNMRLGCYDLRLHYGIGWGGSITDELIHSRTLYQTEAETINWFRDRAIRILADRLASDGIKALTEGHARVETHETNFNASIIVSPHIPDNTIMIHPNFYGKMLGSSLLWTLLDV